SRWRRIWCRSLFRAASTRADRERTTCARSYRGDYPVRTLRLVVRRVPSLRHAPELGAEFSWCLPVVPDCAGVQPHFLRTTTGARAVALLRALGSRGRCRYVFAGSDALPRRGSPRAASLVEEPKGPRDCSLRNRRGGLSVSPDAHRSVRCLPLLRRPTGRIGELPAIPLARDPEQHRRASGWTRVQWLAACL